MPRFMLTIAYDGTDFHGWQKQNAADPSGLDSDAADDAHLADLLAPTPAGVALPGAAVALRTVQGVVERAVREVVREPVQLLGASRTDAGVHARMQVAAFTRFDPEREEDRRGPPDDRLALAINSRLPDDVLVTECRRVNPRFDPIGHCEAKGYRYLLHTGPERPLWNRRYVHQSRTPLNETAMREGAALLIGEHDFAAFAAAGHGRLTTIRTVLACDVSRLDEHTLAIDVSGTGFLWNMVRIIAGTLLEVGRGRRTPADVAAALASRDRRLAGPTLPPTGLCLMWIRYPEAVFDLEAQLPMTRGQRVNQD